jgi:hypothetical protein
MLADLPWWIDRLTEAATGQAKLGGGGRHMRNEPDGLIEYTDPYDGDERLARDIAAGKFGRDRVLAAGRVNAKASRLLDEVNNSLTTTLRALCEERGVPMRNVRAYPPQFVGALQSGAIRCSYASGAQFSSRWLSEHISAIAADEGAGRVYAEASDYTRDIEHVINRPVPPRFCGPCSTSVDYGHDMKCELRHPHPCGTRLMAGRVAIEVHCPQCKTTHNVEALIKRLLADVGHWRFTREELIGSRTGEWAGIMSLLDEPVSKSTFHRWCKDGLLVPAGYRRPDGTNRISRHGDDDVPIYRLSRLRDLRDELGAKQARAMRWTG